MRSKRFVLGVLAATSLGGVAAHAGQFTTLLSFAGPSFAGPAGANSFTDVNGTLYDTTEGGGSSGNGTLFSYTPGSGSVNILVNFPGRPGGAAPADHLTDVNGTLYGTTYNGGTETVGTMFSYTPGSHSVQTLFSFVGINFAGINGALPEARLIDVNGTLYSTTAEGGSSANPNGANVGTVFSYTPSTGSAKILASFSGGANGGLPQAGFADVNGTLYGTTLSGGSAGDGTLFSYTPGSSFVQTLASFTGSNGANPLARLIDVNGTLYGTTYAGGSAGDGVLFSYTPGTPGTPGSGIQDLVSFTGANGAKPYAALTDVNGTLYGVTGFGGSAGDGTLFSYTPGDNFVHTLATFTGTSNGAYPVATLTDVNGTLYGVTYAGGSAGDGTVFSYDVPEPASLALLGAGLAGMAFARRRRG